MKDILKNLAFLAVKSITMHEQPTCLQYLAPCAFLTFPKVENIIKSTFFYTNAIKNAVTKEFQGIPKGSFQKCIDAFKKKKVH